MRHIFICMAQLISITFGTGQLQILMNFINTPHMIQKLPYGALFGPEESLDPASLRMKTEKLPQSHHNLTQRWSMNFCPRIFHQIMVPCGFNKMVLRPTRQWLASLRFTVCFRRGDSSFRWCATASPFAGPNSSRLFCGVIWKVKCTVIALQTYMHSNQTYRKKSPNFQKKHFKRLCAASQLVCTCVLRRVVTT